MLLGLLYFPPIQSPLAFSATEKNPPLFVQLVDSRHEAVNIFLRTEYAGLSWSQQSQSAIHTEPLCSESTQYESEIGHSCYNREDVLNMDDNVTSWMTVALHLRVLLWSLFASATEYVDRCGDHEAICFCLAMIRKSYDNDYGYGYEY